LRGPDDADAIKNTFKGIDKPDEFAKLPQSIQDSFNHKADNYDAAAVYVTIKGEGKYYLVTGMGDEGDLVSATIFNTAGSLLLRGFVNAHHIFKWSAPKK
jgi:hypothetical protein